MNSTEIILATLNARYQHSAFGLRYLLANLRELSNVAEIMEFTVKEDPLDIVTAILSKNPKIVGLAVYIWNTDETLQVVHLLKKLKPELIVVVGGPEVSYEIEQQQYFELVDFVVKGEGEDIFYQLCQQILQGESLPDQKILSGVLPEISQLKLPYHYYSDEDIKNRVIYVEASRGCPFKCQYCLSSLDKKVRAFPLEHFLNEMQILIDRGARQFKFVDRTFNLDIKSSTAILRFFLNQINLGLFLHFEMVPDRFPEELKQLVVQFPKGSLQFEIGIQTWNPQVARLISRNQDYNKVQDNLKYLRAHTGVHTHADLIAGLPGEDINSFAHGFNELLKLSPDEIQVGILKRLRGTPISYENEKRGLFFANYAPYQILYSDKMSFSDILKVRRFAFYWDTFANSGNFKVTFEFIDQYVKQTQKSWFWFFDQLCDFFSTRHRHLHSVSLASFVESVYLALGSLQIWDDSEIQKVLVEDYVVRGRRSTPAFLVTAQKVQDLKLRSQVAKSNAQKSSSLVQRQNKHLS